MITFFKKHFREIVLVMTAFICAALIAVGVMMLSEYTANLEEQAGVRGLLYTTDASNNIQDTIGVYERRVSMMAESVVAQNPQDAEGFLTAVAMLRRDKRFSDLLFFRYVKDGVEYSEYGSEYNTQLEAPAIRNHMNDREIVCTGVVTDHLHSLAVVGFITPVSNCPYADNIIFFFSPDGVVQTSGELNQEYIETSLLTAVCSNEGEILNILYRAEGQDFQLHNNFFEAVKDKINNKSVLDASRVLIQTGSAGSFPVLINGEEHILAVSSIGRSDASFSVVALYRSQEIYSGGYSTISIVLGMLSVFLVLLLGMTIASIITYHRTNQKILTLNDTDVRLGCGTRIKFEREAAEILEQNKGTDFAVVVVCIKHYTYFSNSLGYDTVTEILKYVEGLLKTQLRHNEVYGYMSHGQFVMLLFYGDISDIHMRLSMLSSLAGNFTKNIPDGYRLELFGGIYETNLKFSSNINEMVDFAASATDSSRVDMDLGTFHRYSAEFHESKRITGYIEVHMESALVNNEFRVFYQPKYNVAGNRPDGSEALVRWYDAAKDEHVTPGVFLPLFEQNGFVTKLDRYVYEQVLKYISEAIERKERVYPVSVNVSRLTAAQPDFVDFYVSLKRKYRIADGFIMIEFTESIAYENYDAMREIIDKMHANGFKCSIDDFGSGFSSYNILKALPMDEIKLDRFFIKRGNYPERDTKVLTSIITLAKDLKMKVTQEGVETVEELNFLRKLGCEVVQGYYYSKPLSLADYITFLTSSKIRLDIDN